MSDNMILTATDYSLLSQLGIPVISESRNYWFLRTQGGTYFDDFFFGGYVAIEWEEINDLAMIKDPDKSESLKKIISEKYPDCKQPGSALANLQKFVISFKKGDIVIIPNEQSKILAFGEILSDEVYLYEQDPFEAFLSNDDDNAKTMLTKRRDVRWIKHVKRSDLDPYLYKIIYSHNTIVDANPYQTFIDRTLYPFYIKGNDAHLTYKVHKKTNIPYSDMLNFLNTYNHIIQYLNSHYADLDLNIDDIVLKINVQSKGPIEFKGFVKKMLVVGVVGTMLFGGNVSLKYTEGIELSTEGLPKLLDSLGKFISELDRKKDDEELEKLRTEIKSIKENLQLEAPILNDTSTTSSAIVLSAHNQ